MPLLGRKWPLLSLPSTRSFPSSPPTTLKHKTFHRTPQTLSFEDAEPFRMVAPVELADKKQLNLNACLKQTLIKMLSGIRVMNLCWP